MPCCFKNQTGQSLVQVLISIAIMGILTLTMMTTQSMQVRENKALTEKLAILDLQKLVTSTLAGTSACTFQLTNLPNHSFDATLVTATTSPPPMNIGNTLLSDGIATAPAIATVGQPASTLSSTVVVKSIELNNIQCPQPCVNAVNSNTFTANIQISFEPSLMVRSLAPISSTVTLQTTSAGNIKTIVSCLSRANTSSCPIGMTLIGTVGSAESFCIDTNPRNSDMASAFQICANLNPSAHFCTPSEWQQACSKIPNMQSTWEGTGAYSNWGDHNGNNYPLQSCGALGAYGSGNLNFRCCTK